MIEIVDEYEVAGRDYIMVMAFRDWIERLTIKLKCLEIICFGILCLIFHFKNTVVNILKLSAHGKCDSNIKRVVFD